MIAPHFNKVLFAGDRGGILDAAAVVNVSQEFSRIG